MLTSLKSFLSGIPKTIWIIIVFYVLIEPAVHFWLAFGDHGDRAFSGLHNPDSGVFIHAMRMFENGFFSPYASAEADTAHSYRYFPVLFFWMYGVIGSLGRLIGINEFFMLGMVNGLGIGLYLTVLYKLFQAIWPNCANRAFLLFSLGGGLGGILYLVALLTGSTGEAGFQQQFFGIAFYELLEGPRMAPWLIVSRLYYTLPLALCFGSILAVVYWLRTGKRALVFWSAGLMLIGTLINVRFGLIGWGAIMLALFTHRHIELKNRAILAGAVSGAVAVATMVTPTMLSWNPVFSENVLLLIRRSMWLAPFVSVAIFHVLLLPKTVASFRGSISGWDSVWFHAAWGYILAFVAGYGLFHLYYGQLWPTADFSAAVKISDPALLGAVLGGVWGWRKGKHKAYSEEGAMDAWVVLWFSLFFVLAISAWGQGWFIRMGPQRVILYLGPPMCLLTARVLEEIQVRRPRLVRAYVGIAVVCGVVSLSVATFAFQGPLGHDPHDGAFHDYHSEVMTAADEECLAALGEGRVVAPTTLPSFGDIISVRGNSVLYGMAALEFSDRLYWEIAEAVDRFYSAEATDEERRKIADEWQFEWVYCPDTTPIDPVALEKLKEADWLEVVAESGQAALLKRL